MTLEQYLSEWERDADMDMSALDAAARNVPLLHAKWWKFYTTERLRFKKIESDYKLLYRRKWEYFLGKMDDTERENLKWDPLPLKILSQNVGIYIEGDKDIQTLLVKKAYIEEVLRFVEDVLKQINSRGYLIRSSIDFIKFKHGIG